MRSAEPTKSDVSRLKVAERPGPCVPLHPYRMARWRRGVGPVRAMSSKELGHEVAHSLRFEIARQYPPGSRRMAEVLGAEVVAPESIDPETLRGYDLVGFGSGIYYMTVDARLRKLIGRLPAVVNVRAFTFFTSGARKDSVDGLQRTRSGTAGIEGL